MGLKKKIWIWKKRREIKDRFIRTKYDLIRYNVRKENGRRDCGEYDINLMALYVLRGDSMKVVGSSVYTLTRYKESLIRALKALNRLEKRDR